MAASPTLRSVLLRSAAFRLAGLQAAIFAVIVSALFGVTWWSVGTYVEQRVHSNAMDGLKKLTHLLNSNPGQAVDEDALDLNDDVYYGLFDATGRYVSGDIRTLPQTEHDVWLRLPAVSAQPRLVHVVAGRLVDGRQVVVGYDRLRADALLARLRHAFLMACLTGVVATLVAGFVTARQYLRRVEEIAVVAGQIVDGGLDRRLGVSDRQDEIDRLSAALNATWQRIESLLEGMRQLSTDVAHELRTPLSHLRFRLEQARSSIEPDNPARAAVDRSIADVDHVLAVFGALLRIAQIQSRQRRAGFETVDLSLLATDAVADYRPLFEDEGRSLYADIQSDVKIVGDKTLLEQLLVNLIENALRHTPRGAALKVGVRQRQGVTELSVVDAGPGIPETQRERVLQRLVRLDAARATPGAGLGLALVKAITDLHEAPLQLTDAGPGLCVTIRFPAAA